jgi:lysozyme
VPLNDFEEDAQGLHLTESEEGKRNVAYQDSGGVWTIGYGHTGPEVHEGLTWTDQQCEDALAADKAKARAAVREYVKVQLTQNEFDALEDFDFNVGSGAFRGSTLLKMLNGGDFAGAAKQLEQWDHVNGKVVAGLLRRRLDEEALFNKSGAAIAPMV